MPARATLSLVVTVVTLFLLFNFKTPDVTGARPGVVQPAGARPQASASGTGGAQSTAAPSSGATATGAGSSPTPSAASGWRDGTYNGPDDPNQFGDVQVSVTISGGRITDVQAQQLPSDRRRSQQISDQAGPLLHDEVLQAQSAQIDGVSGATYTSESYAQSVQSALDQAHG